MLQKENISIMEKIAILGAGVMGSAVSWPLTDNGFAVNLIGTHLDDEIIKNCKEDRFHPRLKRRIPDNVSPFYFSELAQALEGVSFIVSGVNSKGVRWIGKALAPLLKEGDRVIAITKGLEANAEGDLLILPDVMRAEFPAEIRDAVTVAAVGGPCIAGELAARRQSCVYFGAPTIETARSLRAYFKTDYYHVWTTNDIYALEVAVALKNAYALGVGIAAGVLESTGGVDAAGAHMHNLAAALFARGCKEIHTLLVSQGLDPQFAYSLPGAGDLYVTSAGGRSVTLGRLMGSGRAYSQAAGELAGETLEAAMIIQQMAKALPALYQQGRVLKGQLPFMDLLVDLVVNGSPLNMDLDLFFQDVLIK
jgi:glycerol-3-phosphate dehydrogenase (NAD(P)+)